MILKLRGFFVCSFCQTDSPSGNQFTTVSGIAFRWRVDWAQRSSSNVDDAASVLRVARFLNSTYTASDAVFALEAQVCLCRVFSLL